MPAGRSGMIRSQCAYEPVSACLLMLHTPERTSDYKNKKKMVRH